MRWSVHSWSERIAFHGLGLGLGAQLHALGEDDLLLRGEQRHAADLAQVQAHGVVGVQDLGGDRLGLGVRLLLGGRARRGFSTTGVLGGEGGLGLQLGGLGIELDRRRGELGLLIGGRGCGVGGIEGNHDAPAERAAPDRAASVVTDLHPSMGRTV